MKFAKILATHSVAYAVVFIVIVEFALLDLLTLVYGQGSFAIQLFLLGSRFGKPCLKSSLPDAVADRELLGSYGAAGGGEPLEKVCRDVDVCIFFLGSHGDEAQFTSTS